MLNPPRPLRSALALAFLLLAAPAVRAQARADTAAYALAPDSASVPYGSGAGGALLLTEFGFGVGGALRFGLGGGASALVEASLGAGRDEREQQFFVGLFGETVTPLKRNYVLLLPLHAGLEQRVFRRAVADNFRPFVQLTAGPTLGYQWPYFDDANGDGVRSDEEARLGPWRGLGRGELRLGGGGTLAVGAYFGRGRTVQGLRFGYAASYFPTPLDLLEEDPAVEGPSRRFFGTPVVSFHLLRRTGR